MADFADELLPGTIRLYDINPDGSLNESEITLNPQPTNSPDDPLRWSPARRYWHALLVCFIAGFTAATSNDAGSAADSQNEELGITYDQINNAAGVLFIAIGYMTLLLSPTVSLYGRRINYLISITLGLGGAIWFARIKNDGDSIGSQFFVGASESCAEAAVQTSLSDIFYQHQRGTVLGFYVLATNVGTYLGPLIAGSIADSSLGWRWIGWMAVIISGALLLVIYFGLEETTFDRRHFVDGQQPQRTISSGSEREDKKDATDAGGIAQSEKPQEAQEAPNQHRPSVIHAGELESLQGGKSYWQRIALITPAPNLKGFGFKQYGARLWHTLRVFTFPAVLFAGLQWGAQDAWLTFYLTLEQDNWYGEPWNYNNLQDAVMNVPCVIGSFIGCMYGGYFSDIFVQWMAKRNGGIAEAEHRLWLMFLAAMISPTGLILFGVGTNNGWSWPVPYVGLGFIGFGWGCAGDISMAYLMDCYPEMVMEGMVGVAVINNTLGMIFTFGTSPWFAVQSVTGVMSVIGGLCFLFIMSSLPMLIWGKAARRWTLSRYKNFLITRDQLL